MHARLSVVPADAESHCWFTSTAMVSTIRTHLNEPVLLRQMSATQRGPSRTERSVPRTAP